MKPLFISILTALFCLPGTTAPVKAQTPTTEHFVAAINGAQIAYTITGTTGSTIVLIHGYPLNGDLFDRQRQAFGSSHRVITVDLRGFGDSVAPDDQGSIELYANDVLGLLNLLGVQQAIIGGHSMGGAVTLQLYSMAPDRFRGMILNDAAAFAPPIAEQNTWRGYQEQAPALGAPSLAPLLLPEFLTGRTRTTRPGLVVKVSKQIGAASVNGLIGGAHALETRPGYTSVFPTISVPTLILYGEEDSLTPMEQANNLHSLISGSTLVIVEGATHGVIREKAGLANKAIAGWLSKEFGE